MNQDEFEHLMRDQVDLAAPLQFRDVLDASLEAGQAALRDYPTILYWLEITFQRDEEILDFMGIIPCTLLLATNGLTPLSPITFGAPSGKSQPFDWERIRSACEQFNRHVSKAAAVGVVRVATDATRKNSTFYRLR